MNSHKLSCAMLLSALIFGAIPVTAQHSLSSGVLDAARQLTQTPLPEGARVAVLDFRDTEGKQNQIGRYLAEELTTHLIRVGIQTGRFRVVERTRIDSILQEHKLADVEQQLVNPEFAEKFRGLLGADYIVVGSLFRARDHVALNARLLETLTGAIHAAAIVRFRLGPDGKIDSSLSDSNGSGGRTQSIGNTAATLLGCRGVAEEIVCQLNVTWSGRRGRMAVLPSSSVLQGTRTLTPDSLSIRDVLAPAGVNATSSVKRGDTVSVTLRFSAASSTAEITDLKLDLNTPDGQVSRFAFTDVSSAQ